MRYLILPLGSTSVSGFVSTRLRTCSSAKVSSAPAERIWSTKESHAVKSTPKSLRRFSISTDSVTGSIVSFCQPRGVYAGKRAINEN